MIYLSWHLWLCIYNTDLFLLALCCTCGSDLLCANSHISPCVTSTFTGRGTAACLMDNSSFKYMKFRLCKIWFGKQKEEKFSFTPCLIVYAKSAVEQSFDSDNRDEIAAADLQFSANICTNWGWCTHTGPKACTRLHTHTSTRTQMHTYSLYNLIVPEKWM